MINLNKFSKVELRRLSKNALINELKEYDKRIDELYEGIKERLFNEV